MAGYWGTRLAVGELSRVTSQVAIELATTLGWRHIGNPSVFRGWAAQALYGSLAGSILPVTIADADYNWQPNGVPEEKRRWFNAKRETSRPALYDKRDLETELVVVGLDGANALREGHSGALSLIGAAPPKSFVRERFDDGEPVAGCYLAMVLGKSALKEEPLELPMSQPSAAAPEVCRWLEEQHMGERLIEYIGDKVSVPVIALVNATNERQEPRIPLKGCMVRRLDGSTVGAALAALRNKVSATVCVCWTPQIKLIALATLGLQGALYCVPLLGDMFPHSVPTNPVLRKAEDFISSRNGVLVSSSISEVCFQDRVRFIGRHRVSVNTLVVSLASHSIRDVTQDLDLDEATFYDFEGNEVNAAEELERFRSYRAIAR
jgi:hypothetical protein